MEGGVTPWGCSRGSTDGRTSRRTQSDKHHGINGPARRGQYLDDHRRLGCRYDDRVVRLLNLRQPGPRPGLPVLPFGQPDPSRPLDAGHICRRVCRTPLWRVVLRAHRRPRRSEIRLLGDPGDHGRGHVHHRAAADVCPDRGARAGHPGIASPLAGVGSTAGSSTPSSGSRTVIKRLHARRTSAGCPHLNPPGPAGTSARVGRVVRAG